MSDLALVRAEIKAWERAFAQTHGRDPSVQDIRAQPLLADRYRLYKTLSRLPPASRPAHPVPPLPGFNPFSPRKKTAGPSPRPNPPATPEPPSRPLSPSPDPIPPAYPVPPTAVSRARKRLRGEPVSPSPNKQKRQRVRSHVPSLDPGTPSSDHDSDRELPHPDPASFVADSPVKVPAGGKSFKLLFDDALPSLSIPKMPVGSSAAPDAQRVSADPAALASHKHRDLTPNGVAPSLDHRGNRSQRKILTQIFPAKDRPHASSSFKPAVSEDSQPRTSRKHSLDGDHLPVHETTTTVPPQPHHPLIPPSPPPQERTAIKGKPKAASRKRLKVEDETCDDELDSQDGITLKVATIKSDRSKRPDRYADDLDLDWDPLLYLGTRNHDLATQEHTDANHHASGTFTVNLPDKFHRVLAISPSRSQNSNEERVVRGLLYGHRVGHHDPSRGGDIWDAGETDEGALGDAEAEDDWESEPVPWEVGEL